MLTFQEMIQRLSRFWEKKGCILQQGYGVEVGAGTFNPATFLRCLGPEPFHTAYVEPCRRPSDGRYAQNPNRLQLFHQYQVILKPAPINNQALYLESLKAIGLKLEEHDIRFVHDDWESPTLGAWGLGWEVWCDGMEITQYTYFQSIGSLPLNPISVEITYGLERLAMYLQNVNHFLDVKWNDDLLFGDLVEQNEIEWSTYNFEKASTDMWHRHFDDFEKEAQLMLEKKLPLPAYDFIMKASHAFNMLDARGVISVTERTGYITRIRNLSRLVAIHYLETRKERGFPLLGTLPKLKKPPNPKSTGRFNPNKRRTLLFEIYSEELPALFVAHGIRSLESHMHKLLAKHNIAFGSLKIHATPRRITAVVEKLAEGSHPEKIERKGPPISVMFDQSGMLTPQGKGFFKSLGMPELSLQDIRSHKSIELRSIKGQKYLFATIEKEGHSTKQILSENLPKIINDLEFPKKMRWDSYDVTYPRPVRSIVCLFGTQVIDFYFGSVKSGRITYGHTQLDQSKIKLKDSSEYLTKLRAHFVEADIEKRSSLLLSQITKYENDLKCKTLAKNRLLPELLFLSEWPKIMIGNFDKRFLRVPSEILVSEMVEHQRYLPLSDPHGKLLSSFLITCDNRPNETIRTGNEKVLSARLSDGLFLYEQDLKKPLEHFNEKLKAMVFQQKLGSVLDKVHRITNHCKVLYTSLPIGDRTALLRAAHLCKADLATSVVSEFPVLQGTIGKYYAEEHNEEDKVANAIEEHWMPKAEKAPLPQSPEGMLLSLADKLDNLIGYFSIDLKPSSSQDPYGLRRQTIGLLKIAIALEKPIDLRKLLQECSTHFGPKFSNFSDSLCDEILNYITIRAKALFEDYGLRKDEIDASLGTLCTDPYDQLSKVRALHTFRKSDQAFNNLYEVYKRAKGQISKFNTLSLNRKLLNEPAERKLIQAIDKIDAEWETILLQRDYTRAYAALATLQSPLNELFDQVLILDEDEKIRENRIALLQKVFLFFDALLDFSKIQTN